MSKVIVCKCQQCRGNKRNKKAAVKRYFKRYLNRWRRHNKEGKVKTFMWA